MKKTAKEVARQRKIYMILIIILDHSSYNFGRRVLFYDADKSSIPKDKRHEQ